MALGTAARRTRDAPSLGDELALGLVPRKAAALRNSGSPDPNEGHGIYGTQN